jgi:lipopolysaccharide export system permease protein
LSFARAIGKMQALGMRGLTMKLFHHYNREIIHFMLGIMAVLLVVMVAVSFIRYLAMAADGEMPLKNAVAILGLILPGFVAMLIPVSLFLAIVWGMARLLSDNELVIGFASGMSHFAFLKQLLKPVFFLALIAGMLSFWVIPKMVYYQHNLTKMASQNSSLIDFVQSGRFFSSNGKIIYVGAIDFKSRKSQDVFIYQKNGDVTDLVLAPQGEVTDKSSRLANLTLHNGKAYEAVLGSLSYSLLSFDRLDILLIPNDELSGPDFSATSSWALWQRGDRLSLPELEWRAMLPLSTLILTLIGVGLADLQPRRSRYLKFFYVLSIFIIYFNLETIVHSLVLNQKLAVFPGLFYVHLLFLALGVVLLLFREGYFNRLYRWRKR